MGFVPDTLYVAENQTGAVVKYGLVGGKWVKEGSVAVASVTGLTANDANGTEETPKTNTSRNTR